MADLALYLGVTIIGYFFGSKLRSKRDSLLWTGKVQTVAITLLVLCMGARMGANKEITENLSTIGISAFDHRSDHAVFYCCHIYSEKTSGYRQVRPGFAGRKD